LIAVLVAGQPVFEAIDIEVFGESPLRSNLGELLRVIKERLREIVVNGRFEKAERNTTQPATLFVMEPDRVALRVFESSFAHVA